MLGLKLNHASKRGPWWWLIRLTFWCPVVFIQLAAVILKIDEIYQLPISSESLMVSSTLRIQLQWNLKQNDVLFIEENSFEYVVRNISQHFSNTH